MDKRIKVFTPVDEIVNAEVGKPSRRVKKFFSLKPETLNWKNINPSLEKSILFARI